MSGYIPKSEAEQILWLTNAATWLTAHGATHGFTAPEITAFSTAVGDASTAVTNNVTAQAAAKASTAAKNTALGAAIALARDNAQRLQNDPTMTDEERAAAGLTVRDPTKTPTPPDDVMTIAPPLLLLDFSIRRQVTVHWGPNPSNERQNGRPSGTIGCQVQTARGGIPAEESAWVALEIDTESPIIHTVNETAPTTYAYRARYVGKNLKMGPFGDPAVCTVSV
jgi:hypothetical protein